MNDQWLPRIVAVGLIVLALGTLASATILAIRGIETAPIVAIAGAAVGALAGFLSGVRINGSGTDQA